MSSLSSMLDLNRDFYNISGALICIGIACYYFHVTSKKQTISDDDYPMIKNMSFIRFMLNFNGKNSHDFLIRSARDIGSFVYRAPITRIPIYILGEHEVARTIMEHPKSIKPLEMYSFMDHVSTGKSFFSQNGHRANHVRKSTAAAFSTENVRRMTGVIESVFEKWIHERLEPMFVKPNAPLDIAQEMILITTEIIAKAGFEYDLSQVQGESFTTNMTIAMEEFFNFKNLLRRIDYINWIFPEVRRARMAARDNFKICLNMLETYKKNPNPNPRSLIHMILNDSEYESDEERARDIILYFLAGFESVAHSMAWTLLELARNPEEQKFLQTALLNCSSKDESYSCQALANVIKESLRLNAVFVNGSMRVVPVDVHLPGGKRIPANSFTIVAPHLMMHNDNIFKDPDSFVPSRWNDPTEDMKKAYLPFAAGKRNCQGRALAYAELNTILAQLCSNYSFEVVEEGQPEFSGLLKSVGTKLAVKPLK